MLSSHFGYSDRPSYANAVEIAQDAIKQFADEHFDELHIVFTLFKTALSQIPTSDKILPVEPPVKEKGKLAQALFSSLMKTKLCRYLHLSIWKP